MSKNSKEKLEWAVMLFLIMAAIFSKLEKVPFHGDESQLIYSSSYFEKTLRLDESIFTETYWTLNQPPVLGYLVGVSRWVFGYLDQTLECPYDFKLDYPSNVERGCVPEAGLLLVARLPIALLTGLGLFGMYILLFKGFGRISSLIFLTLFFFNPITYTSFLQAKREGPLLFFLALILLVIIKGVKYWLGNSSILINNTLSRKLYGYLSLLGILIGLTTEIKINGALLGSSVCAFFILIVIVYPNGLSKQEKITILIRGIFTIFITALISFIVLNPYLYPSPLRNIGRMFKWQIQEISEQLISYPLEIVPQDPTRFPIVFNQIMFGLSIFKHYILNLILLGFTISGAIIILKESILWFRGKNPSLYFSPILLIIPLSFALMSWLTPLNWERYYLFGII